MISSTVPGLAEPVVGSPADGQVAHVNSNYVDAPARRDDPTDGSNMIAEVEVETPWSVARRRRMRGRFLKGPIPLTALQRAARLRGHALALYLAIRHRCDLQKGGDVTLPADYLAAWGICKSAKSRGLADLEAEGLVAVERRAGHTARVKLLV